MTARPRREQRGTIVPLRPKAELSDEALLAACAVGDSAALGALFDRHHEAVFRLISRLLRSDPAETDDLVQTTFLEAWRSAGRFKATGSVRSFLFGIAANTVRQHVRSTMRRRRATADWEPPAPRNAPDDLVSRNQQVTALARALDELPHDLRAAYVLCDLEDVPGVEAARLLDVRAGTLWRRLHEARRALRALIERGLDARPRETIAERGLDARPREEIAERGLDARPREKIGGR